MTNVLYICLLFLALKTEEIQPISAKQKSTTTQPQSKEEKNTPSERKLMAGMPYLTNHIVHHQPYYASGYAPYHAHGPMMMPPPSPMLALPPTVPPPPPIFTSGQLPIQNAYHIIHHPQHLASPWNVNAFPHTFNPYLGHHWAMNSMHPSSYAGIPYGLHPFSFPGVGHPYGMNPYYNPYMSMMGMGSIHPFIGASQYPISHMAGGYGMHGPNNPANFDESSYANNEPVPNEQEPSNNDSGVGRKLNLKTDNGLPINAENQERYLKDLEKSKAQLIATLKESLRQLTSS